MGLKEAPGGLGMPLKVSRVGLEAVRVPACDAIVRIVGPYSGRT